MADTAQNTIENMTVHHADHGISSAQLSYAYDKIVADTPDGFFIRQVVLPHELGNVPCGLHGPAMGDPAVTDEEVTYESRGDRPWSDRLVNREPRFVNYVQAIGIRDGDKVQLFTCYGGPLAPQNPSDPSNQDVEGSKTFWALHALGAQNGDD